MSKYKVGDKIILTVTGMTEMGTGYSFYMLNDNFNLWEQSIDNHAEPLTAYTEPLEAKIRRQAAEITRMLAENKRLKDENKKMLFKVDSYELYGDQHEEEYNQAFNQGAEAAWELVRKIFHMETNDIEDIFIKEDAWNLGTVLNNYTYQEAVAKVAEWGKAKEEIKVGDVVSREGLYGVVKSVSNDWLNGITASGISFQWLKRKCTKTGRHIDIGSFLKQIGEE